MPVSLTGSDVDGTVTSVVINRLPTLGTLLLADGMTPVLLGQTLTAAQASTLVLRPLDNQFGDDSIGFTVVDNAGASSTPGDWTVRINPVDDLPVATPDTFTVAEDGSVTINVRFNDSDVETPALTITHVNGNPVTDGGPAVVVPNGTVQLVGGQLLFTPAANYSGPANFSYSITDGAHTADGRGERHRHLDRRPADRQCRFVRGVRRRLGHDQRGRQRHRHRWRHADDHARQRHADRRWRRRRSRCPTAACAW